MRVKPDKLSTLEFHEALFQKSESSHKSPSFAKKLKHVGSENVQDYLKNSINTSELKFQIKQVIEMKQTQNIENDLIRSDDYINELTQYLLQFEILAQQQLTGISQTTKAQSEQLLQELGGVNYLIIFLTNLTTPIKRELLDIIT